MIIEKLSNTAIKICIDNSEMIKYGVSFETLDEKSHETKYMISDILKNTYYNTGMNFLSSRLFIEIFSISEDNSCIIYISLVNDDDEVSEPYLFYVLDFNSIENCTGFVRHIYHEYSNAIKQSSLYYAENSFKLSIEVLFEYEENIVISAMEFGSISGYGELYMLHVEEQYECIIKENAVNTLSELAFK